MEKPTIELTANNGNKLGIANLKQLVAYSARLIKQAQSVAADKKISWWEALASIPILREGFELFIQYEQLLAEVQDLNADEMRQLLNTVGEVFQINVGKAHVVLNELILPIFQIVAQVKQISQAAQNLLSDVR